MKIKLSSKGQVVLPVAARARYGLKAGDTLELVMKKDLMALVPKAKIKRKARFITDPVTGMVALTLGPGAPVITSEMVNKLLEDVP